MPNIPVTLQAMFAFGYAPFKRSAAAHSNLLSEKEKKIGWLILAAYIPVSLLVSIALFLK